MEQKTKTFAEIYESQGHYIKAMEIYVDLFKENSLDTELLNKIKNLQDLILIERDKKKKIADEKLAFLNSLLNKFLSYKSI